VAGPIRDTGQHVLQSSFETENSSSHSYCHTFFLVEFLEEAFIRNIMILLCVNYEINNNNNAVINNNNNYGRLQNLILLFKIPLGTRKDFLDVYRQFGHEPSERFTSCGIVYTRCGRKVMRLATLCTNRQCCCLPLHLTVRLTPAVDSVQV
jgi:hypothetical protein